MSVNSYSEALFHVKRGFMIIGLAGYTGSGCTSAAEILQRLAKPDLPGYDSIKSKSDDPTGKRIHDKLLRTWEQLDWESFVKIDVGRLIFCFAIIRVIEGIQSSHELEVLAGLVGQDQDSVSGIKLLAESRTLTSDEEEKLLQAYQQSEKLYERLYKALSDDGQPYTKAKWITLLQDFGDSIRKFGCVCPDVNENPHPKNIFVLPGAIRQIIKCYRRSQRRSHFVIDAFRNPYEVEYFQRRYGEFYLVGVLRDQDKRRKETQDKGLDLDFVQKLEERESGVNVRFGKSDASDCLASLNIDACLQKSDFFIHNVESTNRTRPRLTFGLVKLYSLTKWPGCIPPTTDERTMQIAMTARQMSGCISRKVGAVILDEEGYVKGVGWNDPPEGQVPCSLRTESELLSNPTIDVFSEYERSQEFTDKVIQLGARKRAFCFKSIYKDVKGKDVTEFTRSLHGEENAILQALANSSGRLPKSILYTTDRTCTLCAKKAYQIGVRRIVYVEDYTDDAIHQTIMAGNAPIVVERFEGATGAAYFKLFVHLIPEKDLNAFC